MIVMIVYMIHLIYVYVMLQTKRFSVQIKYITLNGIWYASLVYKSSCSINDVITIKQGAKAAR